MIYATLFEKDEDFWNTPLKRWKLEELGEDLKKSYKNGLKSLGDEICVNKLERFGEKDVILVFFCVWRGKNRV